MSSEERNINLVVKPGVVATEAALMFDIVYVLAYALQKLEEAMHPVNMSALLIFCLFIIKLTHKMLHRLAFTEFLIIFQRSVSLMVQNFSCPVPTKWTYGYVATMFS